MYDKDYKFVKEITNSHCPSTPSADLCTNYGASKCWYLYKTIYIYRYGLTCNPFTGGTHVEIWGMVTMLPQTFTFKEKNTKRFVFEFTLDAATEPITTTTAEPGAPETTTTGGGYAQLPPVLLTLIGLSFAGLIV